MIQNLFINYELVQLSYPDKLTTMLFKLQVIIEISDPFHFSPSFAQGSGC